MTHSLPLYTPDRLIAYLHQTELEHQIFHHVPVFTVAEADEVSAALSGLHTRNLFLKDKKGQMFLVTLRHDTLLDLKKLSQLLGAGRFSFGSPDRLWEYLGVRPGSVTPLAILNDTGRHVRLILEKDMMAGDLINVHPLDNSMTVSMTPQVLVTILEKHAITAQIIDLSPAAPDHAA